MKVVKLLTLNILIVISFIQSAKAQFLMPLDLRESDLFIEKMLVDDFDVNGLNDYVLIFRNKMVFYYQNSMGFSKTNYYYDFQGGMIDIKSVNLDGDQYKDILIHYMGGYSDEKVDSLQSFLRNENGIYEVKTSHLFQDSFLEGVVCGDLNGDNYGDLAYSENDSLKVLVGNGDGTFIKSKNYANFAYSNSIKIANLNGDDFPDLIIYGQSTFVREGKGNGEFKSSTEVTGMPEYINSLYVTDFNNDSLDDLLIVTSDNTEIYIRDLASGFILKDTFPYRKSDLLIADVNGDHYKDIVSTEFVIVNQEYKEFVEIAQPNNRWADFNYFLSWDAADMNNDGLEDMVCLFSAVNQKYVTTLPSTGKDEFYSMNMIIDSRADRYTKPIIGDFNNDGHEDVVYPDYNSLKTYLGDGNANFSEGIITNVDDEYEKTTVGDFNADGQLDIIAILGNYMFMYSGNGDGSFTFKYKSFESRFDYVANLVTGYFNNDDFLDLVISDTYAEALFVYLGNGDATFTYNKGYKTSSLQGEVGIGDFNNDNVNDLITTVYASRELNLFLGNNDGTFQDRQVIASESQAFSRKINVININEDSYPDVVLSGNFENNITILYGSGDGTFIKKDFYSGEYPSQSVAGDFDSDGYIDLVVANSGESSITILYGSYGGISTKRKHFFVHEANPVVLSADFNTDGQLDVLTSNTLLLNNGIPIPKIYEMSSSIGEAYDTIIMTGLNLGETYSVEFDGVLANFDVISNQKLKVEVPATGEIKGNFLVRTSSGTALSPLFEVFCNLPKPSIVYKKEVNILQSSETTGNQWFLNNSLIDGAIQQNLEISKTGYYSVEVFINNCKSVRSDTLWVEIEEDEGGGGNTGTITQINNDKVGRDFSVFPNPFKNELFIRLAEPASKVRINIYDLCGMLTKTSSFTTQKLVRINTENINAGIYLVEVIVKSNSHRVKLVKK